MGLSHPLATVIRSPAMNTRTLVLVTRTERKLVLTIHARELDQVITAISLTAQVTRTLGSATSTGRTSDLLARVLMGLGHPLATVIRQPAVHIVEPAISTERKSAVTDTVPWIDGV